MDINTLNKSTKKTKHNYFPYGVDQVQFKNVDLQQSQNRKFYRSRSRYILKIYNKYKTKQFCTWPGSRYNIQIYKIPFHSTVRGQSLFNGWGGLVENLHDDNSNLCPPTQMVK